MIQTHYFINANVFNRRKLWKIMMLISMMLTMSMANASCINGAENTPSEKKLYIYSCRELSGFFKDIGYPDLWYNDIRISRNSNGTALRFLNERKKKIVVVTCDGSITLIDSPGYLAWLNDANQVIAWFDEKSRVHYANGTSEKRPFSPYSGPDPSGKYFIKQTPDSSILPLSESCNTIIYSTEKPNIPLIEVDICGAQKIFYKDSKIYLTGNQYHDGKWQEEVMYIFQEKENTLEQVDRLIVHRPSKSPAPFYAEDLSPWDNEALYLDVYDFPSRSRWYSFNLKTRQLIEVGKVPFWGGRAFYLQCDIVKKAKMGSPITGEKRENERAGRNTKKL